MYRVLLHRVLLHRVLFYRVLLLNLFIVAFHQQTTSVELIAEQHHQLAYVVWQVADTKGLQKSISYGKRTAVIV